MILSTGKEVRGLNPTESASTRDKKLFLAWCRYEVTTEDAVNEFNRRNWMDLTEEEFVEYLNYLGWKLGEYE